ncbi:endonuclease [Pukyongia salina]|uniref:Endonuclease n=2 Tax=Pukyongia salina TaxID=2094025 RepID=A0A2S0HWD5_9FLAO|nr:endonuclease [Pukyongia salina]
MLALYIVTVIFIISPFFPATRNPHWFFRTPDFIRAQTVVIQVILLVLLLILIKTFSTEILILLAALGISTIYQLVKIIPYTSVYPRKKNPFSSDGHVSILAANVLQDNKDYNDFIGLVGKFDPDLVLTMESDSHWENALQEIENNYPFTVKIPLENYYGMHLYSRVKLESVETNFLVENDVPSIFFKYPAAGNPIFFTCLHPAPPSPTENETAKERDAELMIVGKKIRDMDCSAVVCGDMNDVVWSRTTRLFRKLTGMLDPRIGRGFYSTFHARYSFLRFPLDHLFHTRDLLVGKMTRSQYFGSDHFAMYYEIHYKASQETPENPDLTVEEVEEVEELIRRPENE